MTKAEPMSRPKPDKIIILGKSYSIEYVDRPSDVDMFKRESLWGQTDYWTHTIRIYDNGFQDAEIWHTVVHEILHVVEHELKLKCFKTDDNRGHDELDLVAMALVDTFFRNADD